MNRHGQRGAALFTAIFLIVVLAGIGAMVAQLATAQQVTSARALDVTRAYYAARARLDEAIASVLTNEVCPATGSGSDESPSNGFTTRLESCDVAAVSEGGHDYKVFTLHAAAYRGDRTAGTLVRRELRAVVTGP